MIIGRTKLLKKKSRARVGTQSPSKTDSRESVREARHRAKAMRAEVMSEDEENNEYGAFSIQPRKWLMDTGSAFDLADKKFSTPDPKLTLQKPLILNTANGITEASKRSREDVKRLGTSITPIVLDSTPDVLSVGRRCMTEGYRFVWPKGSNPYFIDPRGIRINFQLERYVPYLIDTATTPDVCEPEDINYNEAANI
eukprot:6491635-Amphidinium_carterae.3